jgi:broad specificity phosphatase PhoE
MTIFHWIRHGQSAGNLAAKQAKESGALRLDIPWATHDIPLTGEGIIQAQNIKCPEADMVFTSPLFRAEQTMHLALPGLQFFVKDSRLIDKESGVFDKLSIKGMQELYPEQWDERMRKGKFFHRPTGGESWLDVVVRVKAFMDTWTGRFDSVLVFSHDVTILCAVYVALEMSPDEILDYQKTNPVLNGSITSVTYEGGKYDDYRRVGLGPNRRQSVGV